MITVKVYSETAGDRTAARTSLFQDIYLYIDIYLRIIYIYSMIAACLPEPTVHIYIVIYVYHNINAL